MWSTPLISSCELRHSLCFQWSHNFFQWCLQDSSFTSLHSPHVLIVNILISDVCFHQIHNSSFSYIWFLIVVFFLVIRKKQPRKILLKKIMLRALTIINAECTRVLKTALDIRARSLSFPCISKCCCCSFNYSTYGLKVISLDIIEISTKTCWKPVKSLYCLYSTKDI